MGFADLVNANASRLTPAEHRIVQVLFSSNLLAGLETVVSLGERAKVSGPTVLRFANKLGFESFPQFQLFVKKEIEDRLASPLDHYDRQSSGAGPSDDTGEIFAEAIKRTLSRIEEPTLERVTTLLADGSRTVHVVGGRFTHHLAHILWGHLHQLRPGAHIVTGGVVAPHEQLVDMGRRDVLVAFDIRRYQQDVIALAEAAKARRATIILITDPLLSPIARIANHVLTCDLDSPSPYDSLVACMAVLELIVARLIRKTSEKGRERVAEIERIRREWEAD